MRPHKYLLLATLTGLAACSDMGTNETLVVDGPKSENFASDHQACRHLARNQSHLSEDTGAAVLLGAAIGAVAGKFDSGTSTTEGALGGALGGAVMATTSNAEKRSEIVFNCMIGRGHNVVG